MTAQTLSGVDRGVTKFGQNTDIDTGTAEDVWTGPTATLVPPTQARIHSLASTDNVDDKAGGDGALTVEVQYLDTDWLEATEVVTLDGTTPVAMTGAAVFINRMFVKTAGANGINTGVISATAAVDATVSSTIPAGEGQTQQAVYAIPANKHGLVCGLYCSVNPGSPAGVYGTVKFIARADADTANAVDLVKRIDGVSDSAPLQVDIGSGLLNRYEGKTILRLRVSVSANNTSVSGGFDVVLRNT